MDHIGRKPVILVGGAGMSMAVSCWLVAHVSGPYTQVLYMLANEITYMLIGYKVALSAGL